MAVRVKGVTRLSSKNQITVPADVLRETGLRPGDEVVVRAEGDGRIEVERVEDVIRRYAGALTGVYPEGYLDRLRDEWDV